MAKSKLRKRKVPTPVINANYKTDIIKKIINRLHELCQMIDCDVMKHITTFSDMQSVCRRRIRIGNVRSIISDYNSDGFKSLYSKIIRHTFKHNNILIKDRSASISLMDATYIEALKLYIKSDAFKAPDMANQYLEQFEAFYDADKGFIINLYNCLREISLMENLPHEPICSFFFDLVNAGTSNSYMADMVFDIYVRRPVKKHILINNQRRLVYQVYIPAVATDDYFPSIEASELTSLYTGQQEKLLIYVQGHAIQRFLERSQLLNKLLLKMYFSICLLSNSKFTIRANKIYIPMEVVGIRYGYFVAEIIDDIIVVKTFILSTHASAPEGRKFQKLTGFNKVDMSYWDMTKLETFIYNTMETDNPLYPYFEESGLLSLFDLNEKLLVPDASCSKQANFENIFDCINKQREHDSLSQHDFQSINLSEAMA